MSTGDIEDARREELGFAQAVATHITPVLSRFGFACCEATPYAVRFQSSDVVLTVLHERLSYEIDAKFALCADPDESFRLNDVEALKGGDLHKNSGFYQASKKETVEACVVAIARFLEEYAPPVLKGDKCAIQHIRETARVRSEAYTKAVVNSPIRAAAEDAWTKKDYVMVSLLYESIVTDLTPAEKRRYEYARTHSPRL